MDPGPCGGWALAQLTGTHLPSHVPITTPSCLWKPSPEHAPVVRDVRTAAARMGSEDPGRVGRGCPPGQRVEREPPGMEGTEAPGEEDTEAAPQGGGYRGPWGGG